MSTEYLVFGAVALVFGVASTILWLRGALKRFKPDGIDPNERRKVYMTTALGLGIFLTSLVIGQFFIQASDSQRTRQLASIINGFARTIAHDLEATYQGQGLGSGDSAADVSSPPAVEQALKNRLSTLLQYNEIVHALFILEPAPRQLSGQTATPAGTTGSSLSLRSFVYRGLTLVAGPSSDAVTAARELLYLRNEYGLVLEGDPRLQDAFGGSTIFDSSASIPGSVLEQFRVVTPIADASGAVQAVVVFQLDRSLLSEGLLHSRALIIALIALVLVVIGFAFWYVLRKRFEHLEMERNQQRFESLASRDFLTGVWNRYRFEEICTAEIDRSRRYDRKLSLIICDVDGFKGINDRFGRNTADSVLVDLAAIIKGQLRASDVFGRWGGDEFSLLLPETEVSGAQQVANKLIEQIRNKVFSTVDSVRCSIGLTSFRPDDTLQSLVFRASNALYAAKSSGKNQIKML